MNNKKKQAELEQELKRNAVVDREMDDTQNYRLIENSMQKIEYIRSVSSEYSQKKLAEMAGIGHSTYKDYLSGASDNIKLKTVIKIAQVLQCNLSDLIDDSITGRQR